MKTLNIKNYLNIKDSFSPVIFFVSVLDAFPCVLIRAERVAWVFVCDVRVCVEWDLERRICLGWIFPAV